jgi:DNA-binding CsgD family transcriptional regulator
MRKTEIDINYVKAELEKCRFIKDIADELGIRAATLYSTIKRELGKDFEVDPRVRIKEHNLKETEKLIKLGFTPKEIAKKLDKTANTVQAYLTEIREMEYETALKNDKPKKDEQTIKPNIEIPPEIKKDWRYAMCGTWRW